MKGFDLMSQVNSQGFARKVCFAILGTLPAGLVLTYILLQAETAEGSSPVLKTTLIFVVQFWLVCFFLYFCQAGRFPGGLPLTGATAANSLRRRSTKTTRSGAGSWFSYVSSEMQGWRENMEDAVLCAPSLGLEEDLAIFAVFDGHGGAEVSARAADELMPKLLPHLMRGSSQEDAMKSALLEIETQLHEESLKAGPPTSKVVGLGPTSFRLRGRYDLMGSTACVALMSKTTVTVANVGDSRAFLCRGGKCVPLSRDHKPESPRELKRIAAAGGTVSKVGACYRIDFGLNLSRALGDFRYKDAKLPPEEQKVSPMCDVIVSDISENDEFLVVACDGLFELKTWDSVCEYIHSRLDREPLSKIAEGLLEDCCSPDLLSTRYGGADNESVIIVRLGGK
eukprot:TRINITY_DN59385_c0_g1_i1.p1 TRINITY_DN59385_c0_g1~~TRINITY_DN59385_c0_g1_i1.p1  ORF type:complete len:396 (-),score=76.93 TRINITY_DN59385_c0_g1_i1:139-1326(-)